MRASRGEIKIEEILTEIRNASSSEIDIVIGTHKLLNKDIDYNKTRGELE